MKKQDPAGDAYDFERLTVEFLLHKFLPCPLLLYPCLNLQRQVRLSLHLLRLAFLKLWNFCPCLKLGLSWAVP